MKRENVFEKEIAIRILEDLQRRTGESFKSSNFLVVFEDVGNNSTVHFPVLGSEIENREVAE